ncbi:MAG TPA: SGNH/GDSL hydrolase family protein, partial [Albitalea sp.]|nr:SGNH/GDSL hydrolase family protein [Albitalea sp.]
RKDDNFFNLAVGGTGCDSLMGYTGRQAPRLVAAMNLDPARWRRGIVVIRIGINDLGSIEVLDALARDPADPGVRARADACLTQIGAAVALIHGAHPMTRIVLVGVLSNADDPSNFERWRSGPAYQNIRQGLRYFDQGLARMAAGDKRLAFFDDSAWFEARWGGRDAQGLPAYKTLLLGPQHIPVTMTPGDHPSHAVTEDLHAGVVWTTLWAQSLVQLMNSAFDAGITPISDDEVAAFLTPALQLPP